MKNLPKSIYQNLKKVFGKKKWKRKKILTKEELLYIAELARNKHLGEVILQAYLQGKIPSIIEPSKYGMARDTFENVKGYDYVDRVSIKGKTFGKVYCKIVGQKIKISKRVPKTEPMLYQVINKEKRT